MIFVLIGVLALCWLVVGFFFGLVLDDAVHFIKIETDAEVLAFCITWPVFVFRWLWFILTRLSRAFFGLWRKL